MWKRIQQGECPKRVLLWILWGISRTFVDTPLGRAGGSNEPGITPRPLHTSHPSPAQKLGVIIQRHKNPSYPNPRLFTVAFTAQNRRCVVFRFYKNYFLMSSAVRQRRNIFTDIWYALYLLENILTARCKCILLYRYISEMLLWKCETVRNTLWIL